MVTRCVSESFLKLNRGLSWMKPCSNTVAHFCFFREVMFRELSLYTLELGWRRNWVYACLMQCTATSDTSTHPLESVKERGGALLFIQTIVIPNVYPKPFFISPSIPFTPLLNGDNVLKTNPIFINQCFLSVLWANAIIVDVVGRVLYLRKIFKLLLLVKDWVAGNRVKAVVAGGALDRPVFLCSDPLPEAFPSPPAPPSLPLLCLHFLPPPPLPPQTDSQENNEFLMHQKNLA